MNLAALAERIEQAETHDSELDEAIIEALGWKRRPRYGEGRWQNPKTLMVEVVRPYTASVDAAMQLVPEGWRIVKIGERPCGKFDIPMMGARLVQRGPSLMKAPEVIGLAIDFPLALCAAALRARAAKGEVEGG